jgi:uncharacterized damage-inducible protein DinB
MEPTTPEAKALKRALAVFVKDLEALPEDAFDRSFAPKARTVADIAYEVVLVNDEIVRGIQGGPPSEWPEGWVKAPETFKSKDAVLKGFQDSAERALGVAASLSPEELLQTVNTPWGDQSKAERVRFMTSHVWYHSGQLNFIQTLLGDDAWHWG